jgi:electron transport complex protein RnfE
MGAGFTATLLVMGIIRELLGAGTVFGLPVTAGFMDPIIIFLLPPGGFFVFGMMIALANKLAEDKGEKPAELGCQSCPLCGSCSQMAEKEKECVKK